LGTVFVGLKYEAIQNLENSFWNWSCKTMMGMMMMIDDDDDGDDDDGDDGDEMRLFDPDFSNTVFRLRPRARLSNRPSAHKLYRHIYLWRYTHTFGS